MEKINVNLNIESSQQELEKMYDEVVNSPIGMQELKKMGMNISKEGVSVTKRFFEAIDMLKAQKKIRGLQTFTNRYDINRWNLVTVRTQPEVSVLKPEWIVYLVRDYGISADWILLGRGGMFSE